MVCHQRTLLIIIKMMIMMKLIKNSSAKQKREKARIIRSVWFNKEVDPEKHYRELIMLFTAWRNETDLLGEFSSYQECYSPLSKAIDEKIKQYAVWNEDFNDIKQDINRIEECYDSVAPYTEAIEEQDYSEGIQDLHLDFNENYHHQILALSH